MISVYPLQKIPLKIFLLGKDMRNQFTNHCFNMNGFIARLLSYLLKKFFFMIFGQYIMVME